MNDKELALVYYNYRHYNPADGRWINRDLIAERAGWNLYNFVNNKPNILFDVDGNQAPGYEGAATIAAINKIQDDNRVDNTAAHNFCNDYNIYKDSKCCDSSNNMVPDPYIPKACKMCHQFVDKYSINKKVIKPVECVAKCLSSAEATHINIRVCEDRNAQRLIQHFICYIDCGFYLFSSDAIGTPEGGWEMGFEELLPDFIGSKVIKPIKDSARKEGSAIQEAIKFNPIGAKYL